MGQFGVLLVAGVVLAACSASDAQTDGPTSTAQPSTSAATTPSRSVPDSSPGITTEITTSTTAFDPSPVTLPPVDAPVGTLTWLDAAESAAEIVVPLDHDDPEGPRTTVRLERRASRTPEERVGVLFVNPGGPGASARQLARDAVFTFSPELLDRFDVIGVEPRGVGRPLVVDCEFDRGELAFGADAWPDSDVEQIEFTASLVADGAQCYERYGELLVHISTMDTIGDMVAVAEALGEDQISYFGFSYGSVIGAALATEYPQLVRAAVLDGVVFRDPDMLTEHRRAREARERYLVAITAACESDAECPVEDPLGALALVVAAGERGDLATDPDLPPVNEQTLHAALFTAQQAYSGGDRHRFFAAVSAAIEGDSTLLQREVLAVYNFQSGFGPLNAINCLELPRDVIHLDAERRAVLDDETPVLSSLFPWPARLESVCSHWPVPAEPLPNPLTGRGAGPILLVTSTGDPITTLEEAEALAEQLVDARQLLVDSNIHGVYSNAGTPAQRCASDLVDTFLIELERPPDGTWCPAS